MSGMFRDYTDMPPARPGPGWKINDCCSLQLTSCKMCTVSYTAGRDTTSAKSMSCKHAGFISVLIARVAIWAEQQGIELATLLLYRAPLSFSFSKHTSRRNKSGG